MSSPMKDRDRTLSRDVTATQIPSGDKHSLSAGSKVFIHQVLGGSYTVQTDVGLYKLASGDADAIGEEVVIDEVIASTTADGSPDPEAVWDQLKKVFDPEIPVNIVDLGLVYSMDVIELEDNQGYKVEIAMTLTAPGCGMGPAIAEDAKSKVLLVPGVSSAEVNLVWEPAWTQSMISEEGKMVLGLI